MIKFYNNNKHNPEKSPKQIPKPIYNYYIMQYEIKPKQKLDDLNCVPSNLLDCTGAMIYNVDYPEYYI